MANTISYNDGTLEVTMDGSTNLTFADIVAVMRSDFMEMEEKGIRVQSIQFVPSGANDVMIIRNRSLTGRRKFRCKVTADTDDRIKYFGDGKFMKPYIANADITLATPANAMVVFELA